MKSPTVPPFTHYKEHFSINIQIQQSEDSVMPLVVSGYIKAYDESYDESSIDKAKRSPWFTESECDRILSFIEHNLQRRGFKGVKYYKHFYGKEYFFIQTIEPTRKQSLNLIVGSELESRLISARDNIGHNIYSIPETPVITTLTSDWESYVWNSEVATIPSEDNNPHDTVRVVLSQLGGNLWDWKRIPIVSKPLLVDPELYNYYNQQGTWEYVILRYVIGLHSETVINCGLKHTMTSFTHLFYYDRYPNNRSYEESHLKKKKEIIDYDNLLKELAWYNSLTASDQESKLVPVSLLQPLIYDALTIEQDEYPLYIDFLDISPRKPMEVFVPKFTIEAKDEWIIFDFALEKIYVDENDMVNGIEDILSLDYIETEKRLFRKFIESEKISRLNGIGLKRRYDFNSIEKFPHQYNELIKKAIDSLRKNIIDIRKHFDDVVKGYQDDEDRQERYWAEADDFFDILPPSSQDDNDPFDGDPNAYWNID